MTDFFWKTLDARVRAWGKFQSAVLLFFKALEGVQTKSDLFSFSSYLFSTASYLFFDNLLVCENALLPFLASKAKENRAQQGCKIRNSGRKGPKIPQFPIIIHRKAQILAHAASICAFILPVFPTTDFLFRFTRRMTPHFRPSDTAGRNKYLNMPSIRWRDFFNRKNAPIYKTLRNA